MNNRCHNLRLIYWLCVWCALFPTIVSGISFSNATVYSYLDEPLAAEIAISDIQGEDASTLSARLASDKDFARAGIERTYFLMNLLFDVIVYQDKPYVYIRSVKPVADPYIELLVEFTWGADRFIKEYTLLIDPTPPHLSKETRPLAFSQIAINEAKNKPFGGDEIQQQLSQQQNQQQTSKAEQAKGKYHSNVFSDETLDAVANSADSKPAGSSTSSELVPETVPDVSQETLETPIVPVTPPAPKPQKQTPPQSVKIPPQAATTPKAPAGSTVIESAPNQATAIVSHKQPAGIGPNTLIEDDGNEVDFNQVLPPVASPQTTTSPTAEKPQPIPSTPPADTSPAQDDGYGLYVWLAIILLLAGGAAIAVKRGYHQQLWRKYRKLRNGTDDEDLLEDDLIDRDEEDTIKEVEEVIDQELATEQNDEVEEIELSSQKQPLPPALATDNASTGSQAELSEDEELANFEREFASDEGVELTVVPPSEPPSVDSIYEPPTALAQADDASTPSAAITTMDPAKPSQANEQDIAMEILRKMTNAKDHALNAKPAAPIDEPKPNISTPPTLAPATPDTVTPPSTPTTAAAKPDLDTIQPPTMKSTTHDTAATKEPSITPPTLISMPNNPSPASTNKTTKGSKMPDDLLSGYEDISTARDAVTPHAQIDLATAEIPTNDTTTTPPPSTTPPVAVSPLDQAQILLKLSIAKQYLDVGDKESAKTLLQEILNNPITNDTNKLEAELMLSSIL